MHMLFRLSVNPPGSPPTLFCFFFMFFCLNTFFKSCLQIHWFYFLPSHICCWGPPVKFLFLLLFGSCPFLSLWWYSHFVHASFSWCCLVSTCAFLKLSGHFFFKYGHLCDSNFEYFTWQFICLLFLSLVSGYLIVYMVGCFFICLIFHVRIAASEESVNSPDFVVRFHAERTFSA